MKLRVYILLLLLLFGLLPLIAAVVINLPLVLERTALFYQKAYLQNLRADFRDLDQHLASRDEIIRLLAKLPDPSMILGLAGSEQDIKLMRQRYTGWINQMLTDQHDIIQIVFQDARGQDRFWLQRHAENHSWETTAAPPLPSNQGFLAAAAQLNPGEVLVSRIRVNAYAAEQDQTQLLTLQLASPLAGAGHTRSAGLLLMTVDVGGLAQYYRDTRWVTHTGSYLRPGEPIQATGGAFRDFPGLESLFAEGKLALSKSTLGEPYLWVPMFVTEQAEPLWVGRPVDSSPLADFRNTLMVRVLSIVAILVLLVMAMAHLLANRAERFSRELIEGIRQILREGRPLAFRWAGPREVGELGVQLSELARSHSEHLANEREHTRQLEQSNRYKSEFLANVSHELRTPLNAILLLSKMLADASSGLDAENRRQAEVIHEAGSDLRTMIDNILDISRIEAGQVTVSLEWIALRPLLEELISLTAPMFTAKGLTLQLDCVEHAPERIYNDRHKLRQIIKNFLSNAAKFTHQGQVRVRLEAPRPDTEHPLVIAVEDTGIGIPAGKEEIIFEAFQQADGSTRRRYGGTGLGLSISKQLAELMGGMIRVTSAQGVGSCFTLHLPLALDPTALTDVEIIEALTITEPAPKLSTRSVRTQHSAEAAIKSTHWGLVVERDVPSLVQLTECLEEMGIRVQTAADIDEALETLTEDRDCALLLLAADSQHHQTLSSIARIREHVEFAALPIIVLGAPDQTHFDPALQAVATAWLPKPVNSEALRAAICPLLP